MKLIDFRKLKKAKKPTFIRQDAHKKKKLEQKWIRPRGHHNKIRWRLKGYRTIPQVGFGSPDEFRGLHKSGLKKTIVNNPAQLKLLNSKLEGAVIGATVGARKRVEIIKKAAELNIKVLNIRNTEDYVKQIESKFAKKQEEKKETKKKEEKKEEKKKEEKKPKEEKKEERSVDDKKKEEEQEKNKILTKKEK